MSANMDVFLEYLKETDHLSDDNDRIRGAFLAYVEHLSKMVRDDARSAPNLESKVVMQRLAKDLQEVALDYRRRMFADKWV